MNEGQSGGDSPPTLTASFYVDVEEFLRRTALKADALRVGTDIEGVEGPARGYLGRDRSDSNPPPDRWRPRAARASNAGSLE